VIRSATAVILVSLTAAACVTTQQVDDRSPDPRDDLPELSAEEKATVDAREKEKLAQAHPLRTVLDVTRDPIVNIRVVFEAGAADDPLGKEGAAALAARLMRQATEKLSAAELADTLFPWAAEIDVQVDKDTVAFLGRVHQDHADKFVNVFLDVIEHPRLDPRDFDRVKSEQRAFLESTLRTGNDEALQREALEAVIYDDPRHPYHHTPAGTVNGLAALTLDDVTAFIHNNFTRDRVVLGVSGGASAAVVSTLKAGLEALPFSPAGFERAPAPLPSAPPANRALFVDKPSAGTAISVGYELKELSRTHPDYVAMKLAETWFGEHRNMVGHLFNSMREKRGLNYGDYAYVEHFVQEGWSSYERLNIPRRTQYFSIWIRPVEHKNRLFALRQTLWELQKLAKDGIPDDESFQRVQQFVQGYWRAKEQEPMRRLGYLVDQTLTGQPFDRDEMRARVLKLTRADVNAAIRRHLRADKLQIVVVTEDARGLADAILAGKPSPITYAGKVDPKQLEEDKVIEAFDLGLDASRITVVPPGALFAE
jgi:zinc protease